MSSYRLLRSNKESGPFSEEQIIAMGFKPYDLIWVEGKSAGWRYPGEIPELKAYAPMVEEQPYDRFFKKPVVPARGTPLPENALAAGLRSMAQETLPSEPARPAYSPASLQLVGKHIHVTLPSGNTVNVTTLSSRKEPVAEKPVQYIPEEKIPSFSESISPVPLTPATETMTATKVAAVSQKDNNNSVGAITYYPSQPAPSYSWSTLVGLITGIATLVGLGVMIGMSINRVKPGQLAAKEPDPVISQPAQTAAAPANTVPLATSPVNSTVTNIPAALPPVVQNKQEAAGTDAGAIRRRQTATAKKDLNQLPAKPVDKPEVSTTVAKDPVVVHPKSEVVQAVNLEKQVNIVNSSYKVGAFGGISGLQCTVVNDSRYTLEVVEVELQYIQANDKVFKTEKLSFRDVAAGAQMTIPAPKSSRGVKIVSHIVKINSREPGLASITVKS